MSLLIVVLLAVLLPALAFEETAEEELPEAEVLKADVSGALLVPGAAELSVILIASMVGRIESTLLIGSSFPNWF